MPRRLGLRVVALGYLSFILLAPLAMVFYRTFQHGLEPVWQALSDPNTLHAFKVTLIAAAIAVPLNTVFGILCALAVVRRRFRGKGLLNAFIDLPLAVSPVVIGLSLFLIYAPRGGWFGNWLSQHGFQVLFAMPAIVLATIFVSVPVRRPRGHPHPARARRRAGAGSARRSARHAGSVSGGSRCPRSAGP